MKIAVIGTGISGNVAARLLCQEHDLVVYERARTPGGHARAVGVEAFGRTWTVDTGFMVYNERTYPNFCRLLTLLGVTGRDTSMSFSVRCDRTGLEYQSQSLDGLVARRRNLVSPAFWRMLRDVLRFYRGADALIASAGERTVGEVLAGGRYGAWFREKFLVPMAAAIWSCPPDRVTEFPAHFLLSFLRNHGLMQLRDRPQWRVLAGTSRAYVDRLTAPFRDRVRTDCPVDAVTRHEDHVVVRSRAGADVFDAVVFACHADEALAVLTDADAEERAILSAFPYQANEAVLHTDAGVLPRRRRAWASWNYHIPADPSGPVAVTYDLSRLQHLPTPGPILLTLNPAGRIDPSRVRDRYTFHHPVFGAGARAAQERLRRRNGARRTYFCGAWGRYGFHEDGVVSALDVTRRFGLGLESWRAVTTREPSFTSGPAR